MQTLDIWDMQLVKYGSLIIKGRKSFIEKINTIISDIHSRLTGGIENIIVCYVPDVDVNDFEEEVRNSRQKDIKYKVTGKGPHKDDLIFLINDNDVRKYGSQGQQRTPALSLKLSEIELVKLVIKDTPVLLLDDVLSELDAGRQSWLLESIQDIQTLISCTGLDDFVNSRISLDKVFRVKEGIVQEEKTDGLV